MLIYITDFGTADANKLPLEYMNFVPSDGVF